MPPAADASPLTMASGAAMTAPAGARPDRHAADDRKSRLQQAILAGPISWTLLKLAWPTVTVLVAQTAVGIAEAYYVGFLGTAALAGVALVFPVFMVMITTSNGGLGSGVASAVARAIGAGRRSDADALLLHALVLAGIAGALFMAGAWWGGPALYRALGGREEALLATILYSNNLFVGAIPIWAVNLISAALRGSGNVKVPALVTLVGALVLIPASPALIFGYGPIPSLGIAGAGVAFALYYGGAMLVLVRYMTSGRGGLRLHLAPLEWRLFREILRVGLPTSLSAVQMNLTVILVTAAVGRFGTQALAAYGIASRLDYVLIPILFGLSTAILTMVGINIGAGQAARARRIAWVGAAVGLIITESIGLTVAAAPTLWLHLFSHEPGVLEPASLYLQIVGPAYGLLGVGFVFSFAAQGAGRVRWPVIAVTIRMLIAAGLGWIAVAFFAAGMATLSAIVALGLVAYAAICGLVMVSPQVWKPHHA